MHLQWAGQNYKEQSFAFTQDALSALASYSANQRTHFVVHGLNDELPFSPSDITKQRNKKHASLQS